MPQPAVPTPDDAPLPDLLPVDGPERGHVMRVVLLSGALLCVALGVVFWLLPVMTGIPFYILGCVLLGMASRRAAVWMNRQERKLAPRVRLALRPKLRRARREAAQRGDRDARPRAGDGDGDARDE